MKNLQTSFFNSVTPKPTRVAMFPERDPNQPRNLPTIMELLGGLYAEAARRYSAALASNPNGDDLLLRLGNCQYELGQLVTARSCFERVIALEAFNAPSAEAPQFLATGPSASPDARESAATRVFA